MFLHSNNCIIHEVETHLVLDFPVPRMPMNWGIPVLQMMWADWKVLEGGTQHITLYSLASLYSCFWSETEEKLTEGPSYLSEMLGWGSFQDGGVGDRKVLLMGVWDLRRERKKCHRNIHESFTAILLSMIVINSGSTNELYLNLESNRQIVWAKERKNTHVLAWKCHICEVD